MPGVAVDQGGGGGEEAEGSGGQRRSRPDVAEKRKQRSTFQETVVKAALLKHLRGASSKASLRDAIQDRVAAYSRRMHLASTALSGLVKQCFASTPDAAATALPDFTSQTFFRQLLLGVDDADKKDPYVEAYYRAHPELLAKLQCRSRHLGDRNIYSAGAKLYQTNFRNSFVTNFRGRLNRHLRCFQERHGLSDGQRVWMLYAVHGWDSAPLEACGAPTQVMAEEVARQRHILGLADGAALTPRWLDAASNLGRLVRHAAHLCRYLEDAGQPAFDLVPIARRKAHYVTVDTSVLHGLLKELQLVSCNFEAFDSLRDEHWRSVLKLERLLGAPQTGRPAPQFTGTVQTDGVSLCVHCRAPRASKPAARVVGASPHAKGPLAARSAEVTVLGMDPGRTNIYCFALQRADGTAKAWKLSRGEYYNSSGMLSARAQAETWQRGVQEELAALSRVSTKGVSVPDHEAFLSANLQTFDALWHEYTMPRWARQRLRLYGGKQRVFARFLRKVGEEARAEGGGKPVAVAYGAAKFEPGGKGELAVPTARAYRECAVRFETVLVDEFRTSRVSAESGALLKAVQSRKTGRAVRGLLWYESTNVGKFVDRDLNAALNIRRCALLPGRPMELCRIAGQSALGRMAVGKTIRC